MQLLKDTLIASGFLVREAESHQCFKTLHEIGGHENREALEQWAKSTGVTLKGNILTNHNPVLFSECMTAFDIDLIYEVDLKASNHVTGMLLFKYKDKYVHMGWQGGRSGAVIFNEIL